MFGTGMKKGGVGRQTMGHNSPKVSDALPTVRLTQQALVRPRKSLEAFNVCLSIRQHLQRCGLDFILSLKSLFLLSGLQPEPQLAWPWRLIPRCAYSPQFPQDRPQLVLQVFHFCLAPQSLLLGLFLLVCLCLGGDGCCLLRWSCRLWANSVCFLNAVASPSPPSAPAISSNKSFIDFSPLETPARPAARDKTAGFSAANARRKASLVHEPWHGAALPCCPMTLPHGHAPQLVHSPQARKGPNQYPGAELGG